MDPSTSRGLSRGGGGGGGREDCWSEGATECLVEAWGDRYVSVKNGTLRQKDWKEVADAVNARRSAAGQPPRTDIQCKNRIDTLKKKYKVEKTKPPPSKWQFFRRLDSLIGSTTAATSKKKPAGSTVGISVKSKPRSVLHKVEPSSISTSGGGGGGSSSSDVGDAGFDERVVKKQQRMEDVSGSDGAACKELARAILKFAEIYEKTESSKQKQMVELEKQRMEFTKELEFERMNMFMAAQLDMKKKSFKRQKLPSGSGGE